MPTLLVIGGSGLVGSKVAALGRLQGYRVVATTRGAPPRLEGVEFVELHKEKVDEGKALMTRVRPDAIVDTAAFHNVDKAEEDKDLARAVNATSTGAYAAYAADLRARYLFISTDFVFDGAHGPYREDDDARPVNHYGVTKLEGERGVLGADPRHLVVRPSVIYGWDDTRLNFATWLLTSVRDRKSVNVVTDWIGSPTLADSLADGILKLLRAREGGVYHLAGPTALSRHEFAVRLARAFGQDTSLIKAVTSKELGMKAPRPPDSSLLNTRAASRGITAASADEGIAAMVRQRTLESFVTPQRFKS